MQKYFTCYDGMRRGKKRTLHALPLSPVPAETLEYTFYELSLYIQYFHMSVDMLLHQNKVHINNIFFKSIEKDNRK